MTAVAPPPNLQDISRSSWTSTNGSNNVFSDDVSRMLMPQRKPPSRSNSSSSISSLSSNASTISAATQNAALPPSATNGDTTSKKRQNSRYLWSLSKAEPTAGLTTARTRPIAATAAASSAMTSLKHMPVNGTSQIPLHNISQDRTQNGRGIVADSNPVLFLTPLNGTFERKTITVPYLPDVIRIGRQTNAKTIPTPTNGFFDSKVLSRQHAEIWSDGSGKIWIRDIKSSNGTWLNGARLSLENKDSEPHELRERDMLELGIDIVSDDQKTVIHHKVAARVEYAGFIKALDSFVLHESADLVPNPNSQFSQNPNTSRRSSLQSFSNGSTRGSAASVNNLNIPRPQGFLLAPVNMEQVIKKLHAEYRLARQQQIELDRSQQFLDNLLNAGPTISEVQQSTDNSKLPKDVKFRFSEPPNLPPQVPLPEKPLDKPQTPGLPRSNTEKPRIPISQPVTDSKSNENGFSSQIASLVAALEMSKKENENQSKKLRDLQDLLVQERVKRETAEAKAQLLEQKNVVKVTQLQEDNLTPIEDEVNSEIGPKTKSSPPANESATFLLQKKLDLIVTELKETKELSEKWRKEKEVVEKERDQERKERMSLFGMIEAEKKLQIQNRSLRTPSRSRSKRKTSSNKSSPSYPIATNEGSQINRDDYDDKNNDHDDDDEVSETEVDDYIRSKPNKASVYQNGHIKHPTLHGSGKESNTSYDHAQLVQAAPYLSAMSVVLLGVVVMTLVNKMSKGER